MRTRNTPAETEHIRKWRLALGLSAASLLVSGCDASQIYCPPSFSWIWEFVVAVVLGAGAIFFVAAKKHYKDVTNWNPLENASTPTPPWLRVGIAVGVLVLLGGILWELMPFMETCGTLNAWLRLALWIFGVLGGAFACAYWYNRRVKKI